MVKSASSARSIRKPVSLNDVSVQARSTAGPATAVAERSVGASGRMATATPCIMSISSWLRMWQWYTYSQPKLMRWFTTGKTGSPFGSKISSSRYMTSPSGKAGFIGRTLLGTSKGTSGMIGRRATIVSSSGLTRTVSFHPISLFSGRRFMPSQPTLLSNCTS